MHLNIHYNHTTSYHYTVLQKCYVIARLLLTICYSKYWRLDRLYDYIPPALARTNCPQTSKTLMLVLLLRINCRVKPLVNWLLLLRHGQAETCLPAIYLRYVLGTTYNVALMGTFIVKMCLNI